MSGFPSPRDFTKKRTDELLEWQLRTAMAHYEIELTKAINAGVDVDEIRVDVYSLENEHPDFYWGVIKALKKKGWDGHHIHERLPGESKRSRIRLTPIEGFGEHAPKRWWQF